ncbi:protein eyes shut [Harmonia axyridis]|uniref:protein eyes shut n=1 Tax=Harmonia axyridis TaxID=115357 RepID=UPI001E276624|nr:protein eyes shut [Harmonia axyridis]
MKIYPSIDMLAILIISILVPSANSGFACLENPCVHGICVDDLNSTYLCYCIDGYTGIHCQTNWNECWSNPCQHGATCIDGIAMFNCSCPPGFTGDRCEIDLNECESSPCLNNGTCLDAVNGYFCSCLPGYSGDHCEVDEAVCNTTSEARCANGGVCEEGPGESFTCKCLPGWNDPLCRTEINECLSNPCRNGAVCVDLLADYNCACSFGFMGKNCEEEMHICETNNCRNNALCLLEDGEPVCYCVPDFHGDLCQYQYDECQLGVRCVNGGTCIDGVDNFTCSCLPNLTGVFCECLILPDGSQNCSIVDFEMTTVPYTTFGTNFTSQKFTTMTLPETSTLFTTTMMESSTIYTSLMTHTPIVTVETTFIPPDTTTIENYQNFSTTESVTITTDESTSETEYISTKQTEKTDIFSTSEYTSTETDTTVSMLNTTLWSSSRTESIFEKTTRPDEETTSFMPTELQTLTTVHSTDTNIFTNFTSLPIEYTSTTTSKEETGATIKDISSTTSETTTSVKEEITVSTITKGREFPIPLSTTTEVTTQIFEKTTISDTTDCSQEGNECLNGGTCILEEQGYKCLCSFDTEGALCEIHLGVKNAAFNGDSYLAHRLSDLSLVDIEFEAKTVTSNGLIFHLVADKIFMSLYIRNGFLEFKFSCGYQTMLLKELRTPVNEGYTMHIEAKLHFRPDFSHCDASVNVNNTLSMRGDQISSVPQFQKPTIGLYFGGVPMELKHTDLNIEGFAGCMKNLKISGKSVNIFGDAEDGTAVTECSSLACLSNPCQNEATCVVEKGEWTCHCKNGYLGKQCEKSVCDNNPCLFGGTCVSLSKSGYICLCPFGKHGHFCENDMKITHPHFSTMAKGWSSYVAYSVPNEISKNLEIKFKFIPTDMDQISMLLFIGQTGYHDVFSDHLAVSLIKGYVMLTWNLGSGPRRIFTNQPLQKGFNDYTIHIGLRGRRAWLFVENVGNITGKAPGSFENLDVAPVIFIGGHESRYFNKLPHDLPQHGGFMGCIFDIKLKTENGLIPVKQNDRTVGRAVNQCGVSECYNNRCPNKAACLHHGSTFTCLCQDSWYGPLCLSKVNPCDSTYNKCSSGSTCVPLIEGYECDCPFGKTGTYCDKDVNITDVSFKGTRSFINLGNHEFLNNKFNFKLEIKPLSNNGLLIFTGKEHNFVSLYLQSGTVELRIKRGKFKVSHNLVTLRSSRLLVLGVWHQIKFGMFGRKVYLSVENVMDTALLEKESYVLEVKDTIYLGGLPDMSKLPLDALSSLPSQYTGCIRLLEIDSQFLPLIPQNVESGRNIMDCDGTPCGGDVCANGGTCWLDSFRISHCHCPAPFFGSKCENTYNCSNNKCNDKGKCSNNKCYCIPGRNGFNCENEIIVKMPEFKKGSYLIIDKKKDKRRDALNTNIGQISINFTTASSDGLLLWHKEENSFIGLGIERGYLKLAYSPDKNNTFSAILWNNRMSDGLWHNIRLKFSPMSIEVDKTSFRKNLPLQKNHDMNLTNGRFFLGNVPSPKSLSFETNGFFKYPFEGCIESFSENSEKINDFTIFEGLGIDICPIF